MHSLPTSDRQRLLWRQIAAAVLLVVIAAGVIAALWPHSKPRQHTSIADSTINATRPVEVKDEPLSNAGYIGTVACAECHREIAESFKSHPMSRSISRVDPVTEAAKLDTQGTHVVGKQ